jgi:hypothetical protein
MATSFALGARSFVRPSIRKVFGPSLSYSAHAIKAPWSWGIAFWAFCTGLLCGTPRRPLHIGEGSLVGIGNTFHPVSLISYPWAQSGSPYRA